MEEGSNKKQDETYGEQEAARSEEQEGGTGKIKPLQIKGLSWLSYPSYSIAASKQRWDYGEAAFL